MTPAQQIFESLKALATTKKTPPSYFFKTGQGDYAEGDEFIGVTVPLSRKIVTAFWNKVTLDDISEILQSQYHEMRLVALLLLVAQFEKTKDALVQKSLTDFYLNHTSHINNWDLVDASCYKILGRYCYENQKPDILRTLSQSDVMWEKRMAVVGTMHHVKKGFFDLTFELVLHNLNHPHDLMHKANGWLLREIGNKEQSILVDFLSKHYQSMPRTSLRYTIEKLNEGLRQDFLKGRI